MPILGCSDKKAKIVRIEMYVCSGLVLWVHCLYCESLFLFGDGNTKFVS